MLDPHSVPTVRSAASLIIQRENGDMLLQLRDQKEGIYAPNKWGLWGGKVEAGEKPICTVEREILEELSYCGRPLVLENLEFLGAIRMPVGPLLAEETMNYLFRIRVRDITLSQLTVHEGQRAAFFTVHGSWVNAFAPCALAAQAVLANETLQHHHS